MHRSCILTTLLGTLSIGHSGAGTESSVQVVNVWRLVKDWPPLPKSMDGVPLDDRDGTQNLQAVASNASLPPPALVMDVGIGTPPQPLVLAVDTTAAVSWMLDALIFANTSSEWVYHLLASSTSSGGLQDSPAGALYRSGAPWVVRGYIAADSVKIGNVVVPGVPFVLTRQLPNETASWSLAGSLAFARSGLGSLLSFPQAWSTSWLGEVPVEMDHGVPIQMGAVVTAAPAQDLDPGNAEPVTRNLGVPFTRSPIVSIWPAPDGNFRLNAGVLPGVVWSPVIGNAGRQNWLVSGVVAVEGADHPPRWAAELCIDSALPGIGVPAARFVDLLLALLPSPLAQLCWTPSDGPSPRLVTCDCAVVERANDLHVEIEGRVFVLGPDILFRRGQATGADADIDVCVVRMLPMRGPQDFWHLGEGFLSRVGVTLDAQRNRVGFAAPPVKPAHMSSPWPYGVPVDGTLTQNLNERPSGQKRHSATFVLLAALVAFALVSGVALCRGRGNSRMFTSSSEWNSDNGDDQETFKYRDYY